MYAIIKTGGKQYRVQVGDTLKIEQLTAQVGETIAFSDILMIGNGEETIYGTPFLTQASVQATVTAHGRHKKIKILKFRRRKHHMKHMGHRQNYTQIEVTAITH